VLIDGGSLPASKITSPTDDLSSPIMKMQGGSGGNGEKIVSLDSILDEIEITYNRNIQEIETTVANAENAESVELLQMYVEKYHALYDETIDPFVSFLTRKDQITAQSASPVSGDNLDIMKRLKYDTLNFQLKALHERMQKVLKQIDDDFSVEW
jgi:hypothetical protein